MTAPAVPQLLRSLPDGAALRSWTRAHLRTGSPSTIRVLERIYTTLLSLLIASSILVPNLQRLGTQSSTGARLLTLDATWAALALALAAAAAAVAPLRHLGPLCLRPHEAAWWLPMPGERTGLLRPVARLEAGIGALAGGLTGLATALVGGWDWAGALAWSALMGAAGVGLVVELLARQVRGASVRPVSLALGAGGILALAAGAVTPQLTTAHSGLLPTRTAVIGVGLAALVTGAVSALRWFRVAARLGRIHDAELLEVAARSQGAHVSALTLDTRALGRLLSAPPRRPRRVSRLPLAAWARRCPAPLRVMLVVAQSDWLVVARQPRRWVQLAVSLLLALAPQVLAGPGRPLAGLGCLVGVWLAVLTLAEPARRVWFDPGAEDQLPAAPMVVRAGHLLAPAMLMIPWMLVVLAPVAWAVTWAEAGARSVRGLALLVAMALLAGLGAAGGALRSGFRRAPDYSGIPVATPLGSVPPWLFGVVVAGYEAALLACLPTALLLLGVGAGPVLLGAQGLLACVVVAWGLATGRAGRAGQG